jgi:phosphoenolpyruvate phosphomutase
MKKTTQFKELLNSDHLEFLMEAHNGLSARIVEEAGFKGIWGSGLTISASEAVRDSNEMSWTQVLDIVEYMSDATTIPIMLDADTGYGNFNNMRRLVRKLEQRNVAAACIEDKIFPKCNSFINSEDQSLADLDEFVGKIKAAKDTQQDPDFCVVARTEAFVVGRGVGEALERADAFYRAGADAVLVHSKIATSDEIVAFMAQWHKECPVVIVPTKYYSTPTKVFEDAGVRMVIWANHLLRASITAMQQTAAMIYRENTLMSVEKEVATVKEIFRLQNDDELREAELRYLPQKVVAAKV